MEVWKDIKGYEGLYQVSNTGKVKSVRRNKILKKRLTFDGYVKATLTVDRKAVDKRVHRLVAEAFIANPYNKPTVNHIDGNKENNNVDNLEWSDRHEQLQHAYNLGLKKPLSGVKNPHSKLSEDDIRYIRKHFVPQSKEFGTVALGRKFGVDNSIIGKVVRGLSYKDVQ